MKYALTSKVSKPYLLKVDEIITSPENLHNLLTEYSSTIILKEDSKELNWTELKAAPKDRVILAANNISSCLKAKEIGLKFYHQSPVSSYYDLLALKELGVCYALLDAPLFFDLEKVSRIGVPIRIRPTDPNLSKLPRTSHILGTWVRPEDLRLYLPYVAAVEFEESLPSREEALYRIYYEERKWGGPLSSLIPNLPEDISNNMITPGFTEARLNCGQGCVSGASCKLCKIALSLSRPSKIEKYLEDKNNANKE